MTVTIRKGRPEDAPAVQELVQQLADYEKAPEEVITTGDDILRFGFGPERIFEFLVAESEGVVIGFALYFWKYSTWKGKALYLEDFYVVPEKRNLKVGKQLFDAVVKIACESGAGRMEWQVLDWNELALGFYRSYGATLSGEWINGYLFRDDLKRLSNGG